jgi:putative transposase
MHQEYGGPTSVFLYNYSILIDMRNHTFSIGEYYHLYNRGVEKRITFSDPFDKNRFQYILFLCNTSKPIEVRNFFSEKNTLQKNKIYEHAQEDRLVAIGSYVIMPNHFHILVKEIVPGGISKFMQKVQTAYTMYFNQRNERSGALFQGRFKSQHINTDSYLKYLYGYIHLNPLKLKDTEWKNNYDLLKNYTGILSKNNYSSYLDYTSIIARPENKILHKAVFPKYFQDSLSHTKFIDEWVSIKTKYMY